MANKKQDDPRNIKVEKGNASMGLILMQSPRCWGVGEED